MDIKQDLHIHTCRSNCGKPSNTVPAIVDTLERRGALLAALVDHIDLPEQNERLDRIVAANRAEVAETPSRCRVLVGAEATMLAPDRCALDADIARGLDLVVAACNHYHLEPVEKPRHASPKSFARHHLEMIGGAACLGFVHIIAHPFLNDYCGADLAQQTLEAYSQTSFTETLKRLAAGRVAIEINPYRVAGALEWFRDLVVECRVWGVRFALGSDSHTLDRVGLPPEPIHSTPESPAATPQTVCDQIGLTEEDLVWPFLNPRRSLTRVSQ